MPRYDASPSRFLPVICALFTLLLALLPASFGVAQDPVAVGAPPAATTIATAAVLSLSFDSSMRSLTSTSTSTRYWPS